MRRNDGFRLAGVGVVACVPCCAGPVLGLLAATGLATILGYARFGVVALVIGGVVIAVVMGARGPRRSQDEAIPVQITDRSAERPAKLL